MPTKKTDSTGSNIARLPNAREVGDVPHHARLAFAARCAARVEPIVVSFWPGAHPSVSTSCRVAIKFVEQSAAGSPCMPPPSINEVASVLADAWGACATPERLLSFFALGAIRAALEATRATPDVPPAPPSSDAVYYVVEAARLTFSVAVAMQELLDPIHPVPQPTTKVLSALWRDFVLMQRMVARQAPSPITALPVSAFGSLWPFGRPLGWPAPGCVGHGA